MHRCGDLCEHFSGSGADDSSSQDLTAPFLRDNADEAFGTSCGDSSIHMSERDVVGGDTTSTVHVDGFFFAEACFADFGIGEGDVWDGLAEVFLFFKGPWQGVEEVEENGPSFVFSDMREQCTSDDIADSPDMLL